MGSALDDLIDLLELEQLEVNLFRGLSPDEDRQRVFGGQVAGQALVAAGRTVDHGTVHSLHAYFLRPGDPRVPIIYDVDRIRDGRSFTTRRVVAIQHGRAIFNLSASFHVARARARAPVPDAGRARSRDAADDPRSGSSRTPIASRPSSSTGSGATARSTRARRELPRWLDPEPSDARARAARVVPRRRHAARRPAAARRASSRTRPTSRCSTPR